jgi:hypothetical protein
MSHWPVKYRSLYEFLTSWCDFTHAQALKEVGRVMAEDTAR